MSNELEREIAATLDLVESGKAGHRIALRLEVLIKRALAEQREGIAQAIYHMSDRQGCGERDYCHGFIHARDEASDVARTFGQAGEDAREHL